MEKKISVIIPCYNVEAYVDRCLTSVVNQTIGIENVEVILINDASTDHTLDKLKKWESEYPNDIMLITYEENLRQGGARNIGMQYASTDYLGFIDADDWIEPEMYEELYTHIIQGNYDMTQCKYVRDFVDGKVVIDHSQRQDREYIFEPVGPFFRNDIDMGLTDAASFVTSLIRKSIVIENDVWFPEGRTYEDNLWVDVMRLYVKNVYVVDMVLYHYFVNMQSTITSRNAIYHLDRLSVEVDLIEEYKTRGAYNYYVRELEWEFLKRFYFNSLYLIFTRFDYIPDVFNDMKRTIRSYFPDFRHNPRLGECCGLELTMLELLDFEGDLTMEDLEMIKAGYLESLGRV